MPVPNLRTLTFAALLSATLSISTTPATAAPDVSYFKLANGLELVVIPDHRVPVITHMVWYRVGSADEPAGKSGIAHFLEHLMFKGTKKNPAGKFSKTVTGIGGQENAFTTSDYTAYFQRAAREHLKLLMELEADRMTGLVLTDAVVKPELNVVLEEQNQRVANSPAAKLGEQIEASLYLNHPYGKPVIGWRHEIEKLTREDALAFYKRFYTPNNAIVVVAGDVSPEEVRKLAQATYGKVKPRAQISPRERPQEPEQLAARHVSYADARVAQPSLQRYYLVPSARTAKPGESEALDLLVNVLGGGVTGRLYRTLVIERGLAIGAGSWYQDTSLDATRLAISGTPKPGVTLPQLEDAIDAVLQGVIDKGVTADELDRAKNRMVAEFIYGQDSQATMARWFGAGLSTGQTVGKISDWPERLRAVTPAQVQEAARTWLDKRRSATGYLLKQDIKQAEKGT